MSAAYYGPFEVPVAVTHAVLDYMKYLLTTTEITNYYLRSKYLKVKADSISKVPILTVYYV